MGFAKDPVPLTKRLVALLWAYLGAAVLVGLSSVIGLLTGEVAKVDPDHFTLMDIVHLLLGLPQLLIVLASSVAFLMWIHRASVNARWLGAQGMTFTPGWSVGYYFIPILNFWKPYQAMKEIWRASSNPTAWPSERAPALLPVWWGLWIASSILANATFWASFRADSSTGLVISEIICLLAVIVDIPLGLAAIHLVRDIIRLQTHWAMQPAQPVCGVCGQAFAETDTIVLGGRRVCAGCKPMMVQRMQEGLPV
jgi:hypothetical protein